MNSKESDFDIRIEYNVTLFSAKVDGVRSTLDTEKRVSRMALDLPDYHSQTELFRDLKKLLHPRGKRVKQRYNKEHQQPADLIKLSIVRVDLGRRLAEWSSSSEE